MSNHSRLHNPNYTGPGIWFTIHSIAAQAKTPEEKKFVIKQIKYLQEHFPCGDCKIHFGEYINKHPLENAINGSEESLFIWTFNFHNAVNFRLKKPQVTYEEAKSIFYKESIYCDAKCDQSEEVKNNKPPKIVPRDMVGYMF